MELNNKFFKRRPVELLIVLDNKKNKTKNILKTSKIMNSTYSHVGSLTKKFKEVGILNIQKRGRENKMILTRKGKDIARNLITIKEVLNSEN